MGNHRDHPENLLARCVELWDEDPHPDFKPTFNPAKQNSFVQFYAQTLLASEQATFHYEIQLREGEAVEVGVHFETNFDRTNLARLSILKRHLPEIRAKVGRDECRCDLMGDTYAALGFPASSTNDVDKSAAAIMALLQRVIDATWPKLKPHLPRDRSFAD